MVGRRWIGLFAVCVAVVVVLAPGTAQAGTIVYRHGKDIWAMNADGSDQRPVVLAAQTRGAEGGLSRPSVEPNGGTIVAFDGTAPLSGFNNNNATGVYVWRSGSTPATRLSPAPAQCAASGPCGMNDSQPVPVGDTLYLRHYVARPTATSAIYRENVDGSQRIDYGPLPCPGNGGLGEVQPNWADPAQIAYAGTCTDPMGYAELTVSRQGGAGARVVGLSQVPSSWFGDFAFSPGGESIIAYDPSVDSQLDNFAGLYLFSPTGSGDSIREVLDAPLDSANEFDEAAVQFESPHFVPPDRIIFGAEGDIWSIPANCDRCDLTAAKRLTADGDDGQPAWTSADLVTPVVSKPGGGGPGGSGAPGGPRSASTPPCKVPRLTGLKLSRARKRARAAGCKLGKRRRAYSWRARRGHVVAQRPRPGATLAGGSKIGVTLSRGAKPSR